MRFLKRNNLGRQRGNIFFALFGAVGFIGVLSAATMTFVKGPLKTSVTLSRLSVAETQMQVASQMAVLQASSESDSGDCDSDGFVEPIEFKVQATASLKPVGGGNIPDALGATKQDPWGRLYGYCVWNSGSNFTTGSAGACDDDSSTTEERLDGSPNNFDIVMAVISAGPDRTFQTTCQSFDAADVDDNLVLGDPGDGEMVFKTGGSDDVILTYTYAEAASLGGGGLWSIKSSDPGTATIDKAIEFTGGLTMGTETQVTVCNVNTVNVMRYNDFSDVIQVCDGSGWVDLGGSGGGAINDLSDGIANDANLNVFLGLNSGNETAGSENTAVGYDSATNITSGRFNVAIGPQTLQSNTTGQKNIAIGYSALSDSLTGNSNIAIGHLALTNSTSGFTNIAIGEEALNSTTTGGNNTAVGHLAMEDTTTASDNSAFGFLSLNQNISGSDNTALGYFSMFSNATGHRNVAVGHEALYSNTAPSNNVAIGRQAMRNATGLSNSVAVGYQALYGAGTGGSGNTAVGYQAGFNVTTGSNNTAIGELALSSIQNGSANVAIGRRALDNVVSGSANVGIGNQVLLSATGSSNIAIGANALVSLGAGSNNIAIGGAALESSTGASTGNLAIGVDALSSSSSGINNMAIGYKALEDLTTAQQNTAIGYGALRNQTIGWYNTAIGYNALLASNTAQQNVAVGHSALGLATGGSNTAIGYQAADNLTTGVNNITIGANVDVVSATTSNQLNIGNTIYGNLSSDFVGIANTAPDVELDVTGDIEYSGTLTDVSDIRLKDDVQPLSGSLDKLTKLKGLSFTMKDDPDQRTEFGFSAQDVQKVYPELVKTADDEIGSLSLNYVGLIAPLVESVKELQVRNQELRDDISDLKRDNKDGNSSKWFYLLLGLLGGIMLSQICLRKPSS